MNKKFTNLINKRLVLRIAAISLTTVWLLFIFSNSLDTADESSIKSGNVTEFIEDVVQKVDPEAEVTNRQVRISAHFVEFAVLGVLAAITARTFRNKLRSCIIILLIAGVLTAITDEILQLFSDGRAAQITDIGIDFLGYSTGLAICMACMFFVMRFIPGKVVKADRKEGIDER